MSNDIDRACLRALCNDRSHGRISRRTFLAGASALGFTMTSGGVLLPTALAATPKRGGRMVLAMGPRRDLRYHRPRHAGQRLPVDPVLRDDEHADRDRRGHEGHPVSGGKLGVVAGWPSAGPSGCGREWSSRTGVPSPPGTWSPRSVTTWAKTPSRFIKPIVDQIESMKADGDHVVSFTLKSGDADFPFSLDSAGLCIYPARDDGTMDWETGAGNRRVHPQGVRSGRARLARAEPELLERGPCLRRRGRVSHRRGSGRTHQCPHQRLGGRNRSSRPEDCSPARAQAGDPRRGGVRSSSLHVSDAHRHRAV